MQVEQNNQRRPSVLIISPEAILPPMHGGGLRSAKIALGLTKYFRVSVLVPQSEESIRGELDALPIMERIRWFSAFPETTSKKLTLKSRLIDRFNRRREWQMRKRWDGQILDWAFGPLYSWHQRIAFLLDELSPDIVIMEHTRHAATLNWIKKRKPSIYLVANSQNVESQLFRQLNPSKESDPRHVEALHEIEKMEGKLAKWCDMLWTCSDVDQKQYLQLGAPIAKTLVVPNGVDVGEVRYTDSPRQIAVPRVLFVGTLGYGPNEEGIFWFYHEVWPMVKKRIPNVRWSLVGRWPTDRIRELAGRDEQIDLFPDVPSTLPHLRGASVGICPLFSGSGTRLKILEAFSAGLPMVSTTRGVEGINAVNELHIRIANTPLEFANAIDAVMNDQDGCEKLRQSARDLVVREYDWTAISGQIAKKLRSAIGLKNEYDIMNDSHHQTPASRASQCDSHEAPAPVFEVNNL